MDQYDLNNDCKYCGSASIIEEESSFFEELESSVIPKMIPMVNKVKIKPELKQRSILKRSSFELHSDIKPKRLRKLSEALASHNSIEEPSSDSFHSPSKVRRFIKRNKVQKQNLELEREKTEDLTEPPPSPIISPATSKRSRDID